VGFWLLLSVAMISYADDSALRRIGVEDGRFVDVEAGEPFAPRGFNYIRLHGGWHSTFHPDQYEPHQAQRALADMAEHGFNTVRVFIDPFTGRGTITDRQADQLSPRYIAHLCDFLSRARRHGVYAVLSVLYLPKADRYRKDFGPGPEHVGSSNRHLLDPAHIRAKAQYMADLVSAIKRTDSDLLSTVLAYETQNELHFTVTEPPFSLTEGKITAANGKTYDASDIDQLQQLVDDMTIIQTDACVEAVKAVDRQAMVSVNVFSFAAVGRSGPAAWRSDRTGDRRSPVRPLALVRSKADYIDIHFYPFGPDTLDRDLKSIEWPALSRQATQAGKPLIMGEFGAFKRDEYPTPEAAADAMASHLDRIEQLGFSGWLYWTYDTHEQNFIWHARSEQSDAVFQMLAERLR
jgi:hypothetical protein